MTNRYLGEPVPLWHAEVQIKYSSSCMQDILTVLLPMPH